MTYLLRVLAKKKEMDPLLARVMKLWVNQEHPDALINVYNKTPAIFKKLDKAPSHLALFRVISVTDQQLKNFIETKKMTNEDHGLESWSVSLTGLKTFSERASDSASSGSDFLLVLKRNVPLEERLVYIPSLLPIPGIQGSDEGWIEEEQEVICEAKNLEWKWVHKILHPGNDLKRKSIPLKDIKQLLQN